MIEAEFNSRIDRTKPNWKKNAIEKRRDWRENGVPWDAWGRILDIRMSPVTAPAPRSLKERAAVHLSTQQELLALLVKLSDDVKELEAKLTATDAERWADFIADIRRRRGDQAAQVLEEMLPEGLPPAAPRARARRERP